MEKYILMIDDDLDDFLLLNGQLKNMPGVRCHYACDAATGIAMMTEHMPAVVLLDMNMPVMNGLECLSLIKKQTEIAHIPVVVFSTYISDEQSQACLQMGAITCLKKPRKLDDYDRIVEQLLSILP